MIFLDKYFEKKYKLHEHLEKYDDSNLKDVFKKSGLLAILGLTILIFYILGLFAITFNSPILANIFAIGIWAGFYTSFFFKWVLLWE